MADGTAIEWADATFNPWIGCTKVSPACDHCYAAVSTPARALGVQWGAGQPRRRTAAANWKHPLRWERDHAAFFARHGRRRRVFCASLADVFDNEVPDSWRVDLFSLIRATPNLDWLLLTKRIGNAVTMMDEAGAWSGASTTGTRNPVPNVWIGATIATQAEADRDIPKLLEVPAAVRFLSCEPMLGPIDLAPEADRTYQLLSKWYGPEGFDPQGSQPIQQRMRGWFPKLDWVIAGGESGTKARPMHPDWARSLRDQCAAAGVPFLFKQWGEWAPYNRGQTDGSLLATQNSCDEPMQRFGKKLAGRLLDGVEHNGFPEHKA